jgi:hypothetical protein
MRLMLAARAGSEDRTGAYGNGRSAVISNSASKY